MTDSKRNDRPILFSVKREGGETEGRKPKVRLERKNKIRSQSLGTLGLVVRVSGIEDSAETDHLIVIPYTEDELQGLDRETVKLFRFDGRTGRFYPIWDSGINVGFEYAWGSIRESGVYMPVGLPRDRLLRETLHALAYERRAGGTSNPDVDQRLTKKYLGALLDGDADAIEQLRALITHHEIGTATEIPISEYNFGDGGHPLPFRLPGGIDLDGLRELISELRTPPGGLPEESLFWQPDPPGAAGAPWPGPPVDEQTLEIVERRLLDLRHRFEDWVFEPFPWMFSKDWPMYQHDIRHSGAASGSSTIRRATVSSLRRRFNVGVDGPINSKPVIVDGKIYVGTSRDGSGPGGTLYKIDACSGAIEGRFPTSDTNAFYSLKGIGGSPAIVGNKVYFTGVHGKVYCVDATTMTASAPHPPALWVTDLKQASSAKKQPIVSPDGDCWTSVLVVNGRVYVGSGEGEASYYGRTCFGFVWCLDADNGKVLWVFCTNKFQNVNAPGSENQPNVIPRSAAVSDPLPGWANAAGFVLVDDPPEDGASPWSSFAYDAALDRVYVGTGNSTPPDKAPDQRYGSGLLALDGSTGEFRGFHQAEPDDSYHPNDDDIDVPGAPTLFVRSGGERVVCYGSKNGSFFLLEPDTLAVLGGGAQRRQLLARSGGTGHPGNRGTPIAGVATVGSEQENKWGVMATPAVHSGLGKIYVGLGGYSGAGEGTKTPFIRAVDWDDLHDAWPVGPPGGDGVVRYTMATPPVYSHSKEAALSSPAVVNDVVFVSTTDPNRNVMTLYALDAATGLCLWKAPDEPGGGWPKYALGPAISGEFVVAGAGNAVQIYTRTPTPWCIKLPDFPFWIERWWWPLLRAAPMEE